MKGREARLAEAALRRGGPGVAGIPTGPDRHHADLFADVVLDAVPGDAGSLAFRVIAAARAHPDVVAVMERASGKEKSEAEATARYRGPWEREAVPPAFACSSATQTHRDRLSGLPPGGC